MLSSKEKGAKPKNSQPEANDRKEEGTFKVILTRMHFSADQDEISSELESLGHKVVKMSILKSSRDEPLPLFLIELERKENNNEIFKIRRLWDMLVIFEPIHKKKMLIRNCELELEDDDVLFVLQRPRDFRPGQMSGASFGASRHSSSDIPSSTTGSNDNTTHTRRHRSPPSNPLADSVDLNQNRSQSRTQRSPSDATANVLPTPSTTHQDCLHYARVSPHSSHCSTCDRISGQPSTSTVNSNANLRRPRSPSTFEFNLLPNSPSINSHTRPRGPRLSTTFSVFANPLSGPHLRGPRPNYHRVWHTPGYGGTFVFPSFPSSPIRPTDPFAGSSPEVTREFKTRLVNICLGTTRMEQMIEHLVNDLSAVIGRMNELLPPAAQLNETQNSILLNAAESRPTTSFNFTNSLPSSFVNTVKPTVSTSSNATKTKSSTSTNTVKPIPSTSSDGAQPSTSGSSNAAKPSSSISSNAAKLNALMSSDIAKPKPSTSSSGVKPTPSTSSDGAKPSTSTTSDTAKPSTSTSSDSAKPSTSTSSDGAKSTSTSSNPVEPSPSTSSESKKKKKNS